ncbi:MAG: CRISPR-associated helicase Cas3' [Alphaproteobacteria bacterium]
MIVSAMIKTASEPLFQFWAKSGQDGGPMHSVPHHSLDVAASALVLLSAFRPPVAIAPATLTALVALHDVGKFTRPFQAKVPELWPPALGAFRMPPPGFHDDDGYALLCGPLAGRIDQLFAGWLPSGRRPLLRAVTGHHGRPPKQFERPQLPTAVACAVCVCAADAFVEKALAAIGPPPLPHLDRATRDRLAWFLAGLAVAADWLGSGRRWFEPVVAGNYTDLQRYWNEIALPRANKAAREAGLLPSPISLRTGVGSLFPEIAAARPLQSWAETVALPDGPLLVTIEDATGSGKTEAALVLAHRLMAAGHGTGIFFALPTMATANAMYARLSNAYGRLFSDGTCPSLVLAHSRRGLHEGFRSSVLELAADPGGDNVTPPDQPAGAQCAAWIADDRRKAFLAEIGAGTIDQAIMAVLPTRHAPLRLFGLSRQILIVDEAHAYDTYVSEELRQLLAFHAALGGSSIVLSATLTHAQRTELQAAFLDGVDANVGLDSAAAYPLVTVTSASGITTEPCRIAPGLERRVAVERLVHSSAAVAEIKAAAEEGAAIAWVRNSVDDAIEARIALASAGIDATLFHARFAMGDRQDIEAEVLHRFGRWSDPEQRRGRVLVATQVIEQSLDLDFDLIVTDLAPADLVIQRAGRLWRHERGVRPVVGPRLLLLSPVPVDDPPADWLGPELLRTGFVYPDHALLWRSARALLDAGIVETPAGIRPLVECAYDCDAENAVPPDLMRAANKAEGENLAAIAIADQNVLRIEEPYERRAGHWEPDVRTPTRLGDAQITFRLARDENGAVLPWYAHEETQRAWALSEVSVRITRLSGAPENAAVEMLKAEWSGWDREIPVLLLRSDGDGIWRADALDVHSKNCLVTYSPTVGLIFGKEH